MKKKILITSTDLMMIQFLVPHVENLFNHGFEVEIACSDVGDRMDEVRKRLKGIAKNIYVVRLHRSPAKLDNFNGYREMKSIINDGSYDIIWTNEPVMSVVTRLAAKRARKNGTKVLYMTHGFHFFNGAPKLNWIVYYPIEKLMASKADIICTINKEDYHRAKTFNVKNVEYIHGIGMDTERLSPGGVNSNIREELGLSEDDILVLSVGELNTNKNQQVIIRALERIDNKRIHYILCGKGDQLENLQKLVLELDMGNRVHFLGYRKDVVSICSQADVFAFPSIREGLGLAALEAMYAGLPLVTSNSRGPVDYMEEGITGYTCAPLDANKFAENIQLLIENPEVRKRMGNYNRETVKAYCIENVKTEVLELLRKMLI